MKTKKRERTLSESKRALERALKMVGMELLTSNKSITNEYIDELFEKAIKHLEEEEGRKDET